MTRSPNSSPTGRHRSRHSARAVMPLVAGGIVGAILVAGVVSASAASLGGVSTVNVGAGNAAVAAHGAGLSLTWTPARSGTSWVVGAITVAVTSPTDTLFAGERLRIALVGTTGASLCEVTAVVPAPSTTITIPRATIDAACGANGLPFTSVDRLALSAGS